MNVDESAKIFLKTQTKHDPGTLEKATANTLHDLLRYLPSAAIPAVVGFASVAAFSRLLAPTEYGRYILVYTTVLFIHTMFFSWINQSVLRFYTREANRRPDEFFSTAVFGFLMLAAAVGLVWMTALQLLPFGDARLHAMFYLGPPVLFAYSGCMLMLGFLRAMRQSLHYSVLISTSALVRLLVALMLIIGFGRQADAILWGLIAGMLLGAVAGFVTLARRWKPAATLFRRDMLRHWAAYGIPLVGLALTNMILAASDRYFLGYLLDASAVGIYAAGYRIIETGMTAPVTFLMLATFPMLIQVYEKEGPARTRWLMAEMMGLFFLVLTPVLVLCVMLHRQIVDVVLGDAFAEAAIIVPWIAGGVFLMGLCVYTNKSFELREKTASLFGLYALAALLNLLLNSLLIPQLGMTGAAVATFGAYAAALALSLWRGSRYLAWRLPWRTIRSIIAAAAAMTAALILCPQSGRPLVDLVVKAAAGGAIYGIVILIFCRRAAVDMLAMLRQKRHTAGGAE